MFEAVPYNNKSETTVWHEEVSRLKRSMVTHIFFSQHLCGSGDLILGG
jgi:hypothetical protein